MSKPKIYVDSRLHIPCKVVDHEYIMEKMTHYEYEDKVCSKCEFRSIRPSEECRSCEMGGLLSITALAKYTDIKGREHISIPYGELDNFEKLTDLELDECKWVNRTSRNKHDYKVKFTGALRPHQKQPVLDLMDELCGLFIAPPRSGKTVCGTYIACALGIKTIIMADQKDFLDGFYETIEAMTNLPELEERTGKKLFGFPKTDDDYRNFQIILMTYQSLIKDSKASRKRLKLLNENFGVIEIDECHATPAPTFAGVLTKLKMKHRFGFTATPYRKDKKDHIMFSCLGQIKATVKIEELKPKVTIHRTPKSIQNRARYTDKGGYTRFCKFLANHTDRNDYIFEWIIRDLERGRSLAIPVLFTDQAKKLRDRINSHFGEEIAAVFLGGTKEARLRKPIVDRARKGEIRCIIGTRRLMQRGINIPKWDTMYYITPMNNAPNWKQESCRILTPMEGKKTPIIRMFFDPKMEMSVGYCKSVLKFCWSLGYEKAPNTPKKMRNWLGMVGDGGNDGGRGRRSFEDVPDFYSGSGKQKIKGKQGFSQRSFAHWQQ